MVTKGEGSKWGGGEGMETVEPLQCAFDSKNCNNNNVIENFVVMQQAHYDTVI